MSFSQAKSIRYQNVLSGTTTPQGSVECSFPCVEGVLQPVDNKIHGSQWMRFNNVGIIDKAYPMNIYEESEMGLIRKHQSLSL